MTLGVFRSFFYFFLAKFFHTLKFESDFFRAKDTEHLKVQLSIIAFYFKKNNDGRLFIYFI